jgi:hypothetical protein
LLWFTGTERQIIDALFRCRLTVSYDSVLTSTKSLASSSLLRAGEISWHPHVFAYDNITLSTSNHVEQRGKATPAKVTVGTFGILYPLDIPQEAMKLDPVMERLRVAPGLSFNRDIRPSREQRVSEQQQLLAVVIQPLLTHVQGFEDYRSLPDLKAPPRRRLPPKHITKFNTTRVTTIEEQTVAGNARYHDDVYINQLGRTPADLSKYAILTINDQLTNSRIRSLQLIRAKDVNPWERRDVFQIGYGLFHLMMNLLWNILSVHKGAIDQVGSLRWWFVILDKKRLNGEKPDYHTLLETYRQILDGVLLNAWREEVQKMGYSSVSAFAKSRPTSSMLRKLAQDILLTYTELHDSGTSDMSSSEPSGLQPQDTIYVNLKRLTGDLLYVAILRDAIRAGDFGQIEDIQTRLAMLFCGAGGKNYCSEILHFVHSCKYVWTEEIASVFFLAV